jgi:hypothetical protein
VTQNPSGSGLGETSKGPKGDKARGLESEKKFFKNNYEKFEVNGKKGKIDDLSERMLQVVNEKIKGLEGEIC